MNKYIVPVALLVAASVMLLAIPFVEAGPGLGLPIVARYNGAVVVNGGSVKGTVKLKKLVDLPKLVVDKDVTTCSSAKVSPRLVVDSATKGVGNVVVFLDGIQTGKKLKTGAYLVDQKGCQYDPHITIAAAGSKLNFGSSDAVLHNVHVWKGTPDQPHSKSKDVLNVAMPNDTVPDTPLSRRTMRKPGFYFVQCDAGHIWMSAYIWVVEHPYYVLTNGKGEFELKDVPAGTYTLRYWHEGWQATPEKSGGNVVGYAYGEPIQHRIQVTVAGGKATTADWTIPN